MNKDFEKLLSDRYGMFVHYGLYSALEGFYNGQQTKGLGEWIMHDLKIPIEEYKKLGLAGFKPKEDFAKNLVKKAKDAGMKYIVLTSKHHDGFCLFDTKYSDYNSYNYLGRDLCKELADECRKQGLKVGFYYSHTLDWYEKNGGGDKYAGSFKPAPNRNDWDFPDYEINFEKYLYEKCFPQVEELLTNYGDLCLIWFDFPHNITAEQSRELRDFVKKFQPNCLINSRIAYCCCDYYSLGDNVLPIAPTGVPLECLITLNDTWAYKKCDQNWKTPFETEEILCRTLNSDATLLLNVGPYADGTLTPETESILSDMGSWIEKNKDAVYGEIKGNPFPVTFDWGYVSEKGNNLYLYVTDGNAEKITLAGLKTKVKEVKSLTKGSMEFSQNGETFEFKPLKSDSIEVYAVEFDSVPEVSKEINPSGDILSLGVMWADKKVNGKTEKLIYDIDVYGPNHGKQGAVISDSNIIEFWKKPEEEICWTANFAKSGKYRAEIIYAPLRDTYQPEITWDLGGKAYLSVNDEKHEVDFSKEKEFAISRTKTGNQRAVTDCGMFEIKNDNQTVTVTVCRDAEGGNFPIDRIRFIKL